MEWCSRSIASIRLNKINHEEICSNRCNENSNEKHSLLYLFIRYCWNEKDGQCSKETCTKLIYWLKKTKIDLNEKHWYYSSRLDVRIRTMKLSKSITGKKNLLQNSQNIYEETVFAEIVYKLRKVLPTLINSKENINYTNSSGQTILHVLLEEYSEIIDNLSTDQMKRIRQLLESLIKIEAPLYIIDVHGNTPIQIATRLKNEQILQSVISCLVNLTLYDKLGNTALHIIVDNCVDPENIEHRYEFFYIVCNLVTRGANPKAKNNKGITPIHLAAEKFHVEILKFFMDNDADFCDFTNEGELPLHFACKSSIRLSDTSKSVKTIKFLANNNFETASNKGYMPLHYAAESGNVEIVKQLIRLNAFVDCRTKELQLTPLHLALKRNQLDIAKVLIKAGADINSEADDGSLPVFLAAMVGSVDSLRYLIGQGADLSRREKHSGFSLLHLTAYDEGLMSTTKKLTADSAAHESLDKEKGMKEKKFDLVIEKNLLDVNDPGSCGIMPLNLAIFSHNIDIVKTLIERGANVNFQAEKSEFTALQFASLEKNAEIVKVLLESGADINSRGGIHQMTPLHFAVLIYLSWEMGKYPGWVTKDIKERSFIKKLWPFTECNIDRYSVDVVEMLIDKGADVNAKDACGNTPLHLATLRSNCKMVRKLLNAGAHVNVQDNEGRLPLHNALVSSKMEAITVIELLLDYGADINDPDTSQFVLGSHYLLKKIIIKHAIKYKLINLPVSNVYETLISDPLMNDFYTLYSDEAKKFINYRGKDNTSFYKLLYMDVMVRNCYAEKITKSFEYKIHKYFNNNSLFPMYFKVVQAAYHEAVKRKLLMKSAKIMWYEIFKMNLPDLCVEHILSYLSNRFLEVFVKKCSIGKMVTNESKICVLKYATGDCPFPLS